MEVYLQVQGHIREFFPHLAEPVRLDLPHPLTVREILLRAGIPPELPGSVLAGGLRVGLDHLPADGDHLVLLSPMAGG
ncbi:MAG: hypothetical protein ACOY93_21495 [Bacillota bacterium]